MTRSGSARRAKSCSHFIDTYRLKEAEGGRRDRADPLRGFNVRGAVRDGRDLDESSRRTSRS